MFTPVNTSLGALLLFQGSFGLLLHNGKVFGISSLLSGCVFNPSLDNLPIIAGLVSSLGPIYLFAPSLIPAYPAAPSSWESVATTLGLGLLVGWGTKVHNFPHRSYPGLGCKQKINRLTMNCSEWPWLHLRTHALRSLPSLAALSDCYMYLLRYSPPYGQLCRRKGPDPCLCGRHPLLHPYIPIHRRTHLHGLRDRSRLVHELRPRPTAPDPL